MCAMGWAERQNRQKQHALPGACRMRLTMFLTARIGDVSGRGKLAADMREIWMMQPRFREAGGQHALQAWSMQPRFRAGFDFMRLRSDVGEVDVVVAEWWQDFQTADDERRDDLMDQAREEQRARQKAQQQAQPVVRRVPKKAADPRGLALDEGADNHAPDADTTPPPEGSAPKKRRRRRRKPGGAAGGSAPAGDA
jgi:poly(A) polymerase